MLQPDGLAGGLQSFLLGRELLRERRRSPDAAEVVEVRFGGGAWNQVGMGVNKNVWKHDCVMCYKVVRLSFFLLTFDFPLPWKQVKNKKSVEAKALNMVTIGFLYWGTNKQTCSSHSSSQSLTVACSQVFFE